MKPGHVKSWCIPKPSAPFVAKMEDVLEVYQRPYDTQRPQLCLDEARQELHSPPGARSPMSPDGQRGRIMSMSAMAPPASFCGLSPSPVGGKCG